MSNETINHMENIENITSEIAQIIKKYYPSIFDKFYDPFGFPNDNGCSASDRIRTCVYIELIKAGVVK